MPQRLFLWGGVLPAHAADTASGDVNIIASVSGAYSLVIPQTITLSRDGGGDGVGTYTGSIPVCVKGTIKSSQYVTVSVNTPTLTCEDGTTAAVSLSQPKDTWTCDEVSGDGTTANFAVSTELAQPGDWSGTATFGCEMGSSATEITFQVVYTRQTFTCHALEGMTWEQWVNSDFNTDGFYISSPFVVTPIMTSSMPVVWDNDGCVSPSDMIIAEYSYRASGTGL